MIYGAVARSEPKVEGGRFRNTPIKQAFRDRIEKATSYVASNTLQHYFGHR